MKNLIVAISILGLSLTNISAQDIHQNEVPSVILNNFQKVFQKQPISTGKLKEIFMK